MVDAGKWLFSLDVLDVLGQFRAHGDNHFPNAIVLVVKVPVKLFRDFFLKIMPKALVELPGAACGVKTSVVDVDVCDIL